MADKNLPTLLTDEVDPKDAVDNAPERYGTRKRELTMKGHEYQVTIKSNQLKQSMSKWRKQADKLDNLLTNCNDCQCLKREYEVLVQCMENVDDASTNLAVLYPDGDIPIDIEDFEIDNHNLVKHINSKLRMLAEDAKSNVSKVSKQSSRTSRRSDTRMQAAATAAELEVKLQYMHTGLDSDIVAKQFELDKIRTERELAIAKARLRAVNEVKDSDAMSQTLEGLPYANCIDSFMQGNGVHNPGNDVDSPFEGNVVVPPGGCFGAPHSNLLPCTVGDAPVAVNSAQQSTVMNRPTRVGCTSPPIPCPNAHESLPHESVLLQTLTSLVDHMTLNRLPCPEPGVFSGNPLLYASWKNAYETLIERKNITPSEKIHYLKRYLGGKAFECVEGYFLLSTEEAYIEARHKLDVRFGDPFVVGKAFRDKLDKWHKVAPYDGLSLRKFADYLSQCETAMITISSLNALNDDREIQKIQTKLPDWMGNRWSRIVWDYKQKCRQFPPFSVFVSFVVKEADILCDASTNAQYASVIGELEDHSSINTRKQTRQVFAAETSVKNVASADSTFSRKWPCMFCKADHHISRCHRFLEMSIDDRWKYAKDAKLCFSCLTPKHLMWECRYKKPCDKCQLFHSSVLHYDVTTMPRERYPAPPVRAESHMTLYTGVSQGSKSSMILPVYLSLADDIENERLVYVLLDSQSDTTFILDDTCNEMGLSGPNMQLVLSTMSATDEVVSTRKISDLYVRGYKSDERVKLPAAYTRPGIPINRSHIPTPDTARQWPHLEGIAHQLTPLQDVDVALLIGYNCAEALMPRDVVPSLNNEPYAQGHFWAGA